MAARYVASGLKWPIHAKNMHALRCAFLCDRMLEQFQPSWKILADKVAHETKSWSVLTVYSQRENALTGCLKTNLKRTCGCSASNLEKIFSQSARYSDFALRKAL
jgi:hypothetical protein